jgi:SAM-dependent methyltransferase
MFSSPAAWNISIVLVRSDMIQDPGTPFDDVFHLEALTGLVNYQNWIVGNFAPHIGGTAVEYGAGLGSISAKLLSRVASLDLIEPMDPLYSKLCHNFEGRQDVRVVQSTMENSARSSADAHYDSAVMVNVLEHIENDRSALFELYRILKPGAALCLFVPAMPFLYSAYDRIAGHYRRYELAGLKRLVSEAGFEITRARYFDVLGVLPWLIAMRLAGQVKISARAARLYDIVAVPIGRALETMVPPPFGKNILLVARKPLTPTAR